MDEAGTIALASFATRLPLKPSKVRIDGRTGDLFDEDSSDLPVIMSPVTVLRVIDAVVVAAIDNYASPAPVSCKYFYFDATFLPSNRAASVRQRYLAFS